MWFIVMKTNVLPNHDAVLINIHITGSDLGNKGWDKYG